MYQTHTHDGKQQHSIVYLGLGDLFGLQASLVDLRSDQLLLLLELVLGLLQLIDLLAHLVDGILVLLSQLSRRRFVLQIGLLQVASQLGQLRLALLVEVELSCRGATGLLESSLLYIKHLLHSILLIFPKDYLNHIQVNVCICTRAHKYMSFIHIQ